MQPGIRKPTQTQVRAGSRVQVTKPIKLNGNSASSNSRLVVLNIPSGVKGVVVGDGLNVGQKVVKMVLYSENGIPVELLCPVGANNIESTNT